MICIFKQLYRFIFELNVVSTTVQARNNEKKLLKKSDHRRDLEPHPHGFRGRWSDFFEGIFSSTHVRTIIFITFGSNINLYRCLKCISETIFKY